MHGNAGGLRHGNAEEISAASFCQTTVWPFGKGSSQPALRWISENTIPAVPEFFHEDDIKMA